MSTILIAGCGSMSAAVSACNWSPRATGVFGLRRTVAASPLSMLPVRRRSRRGTPPAAWPREPSTRWSMPPPRPTMTKPAIAPPMSRACATCSAGWPPATSVRSVCCSSPAAAVYAQGDGAWVDETTPAEPERFSGRILREAEDLALGSGPARQRGPPDRHLWPGTRGAAAQVREGSRVTREPPLYGNRIHVEDAAGLLALLLQRDREGVALDDLYLGVDDDPAPLDEVSSTGCGHGWASPSGPTRPVASRRQQEMQQRPRPGPGLDAPLPSYRGGLRGHSRRLKRRSPAQGGLRSHASQPLSRAGLHRGVA